MKSKDSNSKKSVLHQKKDGRGWYDNDKDLKVSFLVTWVILGVIIDSCNNEILQSRKRPQSHIPIVFCSYSVNTKTASQIISMADEIIYEII